MKQSTQVYNLIVDIVNNYKKEAPAWRNNQVYLMPLRMKGYEQNVLKRIQLSESIDLLLIRVGQYCQANIRVNSITVSIMSKVGISNLPAEKRNDLIKFNSLIKSIDRDWTDVIIELQEMLIEIV